LLDRPAQGVVTPTISVTLLSVLTLGVAVLVANLYYAEPLIASIGVELHISPAFAGRSAPAL